MTSAEGGSRNATNFRTNLGTNGIDFADKGGEGVKQSHSSVDVIYGSPLGLFPLVMQMVMPDSQD